MSTEEHRPPGRVRLVRPEKPVPEPAAPATTPIAPTASVANPSRLEPFRHLLGEVADRDIARQAGVSRSAITTWRNRLGIRSARQSGVLNEPAQILDEHRADIGVVSDAELARRHRVPLSAVRAFRQQLGLRPASRGGIPRPPRKPKPRAPQATIQDAAKRPYMVQLADGRTGLVHATTLLDAALAAEAHGELVSVRLAELL